MRLAVLLPTLAILLLGPMGRMWAEDAPAPELPVDAASRLIESFDAGEDETFDELARREAPDGWLVADALMAEGHGGAPRLTYSAGGGAGRTCSTPR